MRKLVLFFALAVAASAQITTVPAGGGPSVNPYYLLNAGTYYIPPFFSAATLPSTTGFSARYGSPTVTIDNSTMKMVADSSTDVYDSAISGKTTLITAFVCDVQTTGGSNNPSCGIMLTESGTGKQYGVAVSSCNACGTGGAPQLLTQTYTSGTFGANVYASGAVNYGPVTWLKVVIGTNVVSSISYDGGNTWAQFDSQTKTTRFTTAPDNWGLYLNGGSGGTVRVLSWAVN